MKKLLFIFLCLVVFSCEKEETCDCFLVKYSRLEGRSFGESSRLPWSGNDDSCENEVVEEYGKITVEGFRAYFKSVKECE